MKLKTGIAYRIKFLDHCVGDRDKPVVCETFGKVIMQDSQSITLATWEIHDEDQPTVDANREKTVIIKSAILDVVKIPEFKLTK
jgi:hypothetical protein